MVFIIQKTCCFRFSGYETNIIERKKILFIRDCINFYRNNFVLHSSKNDSKNVKRKYYYMNIYKFKIVTIECMKYQAVKNVKSIIIA